MIEKYPLPEGWRWVRLGEVCEINYPKPKNFIRTPDAPTTFIPMASVDEKTGTYNPQIVPYSKIAKGYTYFEENDVLFAKITPCMQNGKHVIARNLIDGIGFGTTEFHVCRPYEGVLPEWIHYFIRQPYFLQEATAYFTGAVGQQRIPEDFLINYVIPLPSLPEQKRIASKIRELMREVERVRTACEKQLEAAKALPAAYLREVFESDEAKKWERKRLGNICEKIIGGGTPRRGHPEYWEGSIYWLSPSELDEDKLNYVTQTKEKITENGSKNSNAKIVPPRAVLLSCTASVGKVAINEVPLTTNQQFNSFVFKGTMAVPEFVAYYLLYKKEDIKQLGGKTTFTFISKDEIADSLIPHPLFSIQQDIAAELKEKMVEAEKLRTAIEKQLEAINALPQAILRKAFRGEL